MGTKGSPARNTVEAIRHKVGQGRWTHGVWRVTLKLTRRGYWGIEQRLQFTASEREILRALRAAGYSITPPEETR